MNYNEDMRKLVRDAYNRCAAAYTEQRDAFKSKKYLDELDRQLGPGSRVLDIGCGAGVPVDEYLVRRGHVLTGVDISETQIALAQKNLPQATFYVKDMSEMEFPPGSFDAAVSFYAIFHIPREEHLDLFRKVFRFLRPGGLFLATLGYDDWEGAEEFHGETMHWSQYDKDKNLELIGQAGFSILEAELDESGGERHLVVLARKP